MKKKIGFVPMDPALGAWLLEMLAKHPPESENAAELCSGVQELLCGEVTSLLLITAEDGETTALQMCIRDRVWAVLECFIPSRQSRGFCI